MAPPPASLRHHVKRLRGGDGGVWRHQRAPHPEETWQRRASRGGPELGERERESRAGGRRGAASTPRASAPPARRDRCRGASVTLRVGSVAKGGRGLEGWDPGGAPGGAGPVVSAGGAWPGRASGGKKWGVFGGRGLCWGRGPSGAQRGAGPKLGAGTERGVSAGVETNLAGERASARWRPPAPGPLPTAAPSSGWTMGLCKCPKRKVTNLFCFEHRVNVCEHCLVANHAKVGPLKAAERGAPGGQAALAASRPKRRAGR